MKKRTKKDLKVGDKIYVKKSGWLHRGDRDLEEKTIEKINTSSLYYRSGDNLIRVSLNDLTGKLATTHITVYLNKEDYYGPIKEEKERMECIKEIQDIISEEQFSVEDLREIRDFVLSKKS